MRIYINERIEEETFLDYIKNKFNFSQLIPLGYGAEGITYQINSKKILKLTRTYPKKYEGLGIIIK